MSVDLSAAWTWWWYCKRQTQGVYFQMFPPTWPKTLTCSKEGYTTWPSKPTGKHFCWSVPPSGRPGHLALPGCSWHPGASHRVKLRRQHMRSWLKSRDVKTDGSLLSLKTHAGICGVDLQSQVNRLMQRIWTAISAATGVFGCFCCILGAQLGVDCGWNKAWSNKTDTKPHHWKCCDVVHVVDQGIDRPHKSQEYTNKGTMKTIRP